jgi:curved DNA-binding protein CbpA
MHAGEFIDYYETLQISPNADPDTIHRVYRILAQRYHPDNQETGNSEAFRHLSDAYRELSDPELRAAYDVRHREERRLTWKIFDQSNSTQGIDAERRKRQGLLSLLYRKRAAQPEQPFVTLKEFEDLLGVPREHLEFSLWYLKEGQYVQRSDNGRHSITLKGVDLTETLTDRREPIPLLAANARVA